MIDGSFGEDFVPYPLRTLYPTMQTMRRLWRSGLLVLALVAFAAFGVLHDVAVGLHPEETSAMTPSEHTGPHVEELCALLATVAVLLGDFVRRAAKTRIRVR